MVGDKIDSAEDVGERRSQNIAEVLGATKPIDVPIGVKMLGHS
jgi:hypothetical protein